MVRTRLEPVSYCLCVWRLSHWATQADMDIYIYLVYYIQLTLAIVIYFTIQGNEEMCFRYRISITNCIYILVQNKLAFEKYELAEFLRYRESEISRLWIIVSILYLHICIKSELNWSQSRCILWRVHYSILLGSLHRQHKKWSK